MQRYSKTVCCFLLLCLLAATGTDTAGDSPLYCSFRAAGFYPDYYVDEMPISQIRFSELTDIIYFSIYPNADGSLNMSAINQEDPNTMRDLVRAAKDNNVNISISVGGAGRSDNFSTVVADPAKRDMFADYLVQFCLDNDLDGIDLDWEPITDSTNYAVFIRQLKAAMRPHSLLLSVDVYALGDGLVSEAFDSVDWLHVMAYDMYKTQEHSTYEDAVAGLAHWENAGFPRPRMVLGLPFFGRKIPLDTNYYTYKQLVSDYLPPPVDPNVDQIDGINFNGINTIKAKTQYVVQNDYGGVMFWELTNDTLDETSLLTAASETVHANRPPDFNCDKVIDIMDLNHLMADWFLIDCGVENTWCQRCDLDLSGKVDMPDFSFFSQSWGRVLQGDINNDTHVDLADVISLADNWLWTGAYAGTPEDIYIDGRVDLRDFAMIADMWLIQ